MTKFLFGIFVVFLYFGSCQANPLDDCTLENIRGVTSDAAAKFIRQSCLGKISSPIPTEVLNNVKTKGEIGTDQWNKGNALYLTFENNSPYAITQITVGISTKNETNDYNVSNFLQVSTTPGVVVTGLPPDPASYMQIKPFSSVYFAFPIRQDAPGQNEKWWFGVIAAKGYLAN
jgi:hypothetical protein